jgi:hypothetical protein
MSDPVDKVENVIVLAMLLALVGAIGFGFWKFNEFLGGSPKTPGPPGAPQASSQATGATNAQLLLGAANPGGALLIDNWQRIKDWLFGSPAPDASAANDETPVGEWYPSGSLQDWPGDLGGWMGQGE